MSTSMAGALRRLGEFRLSASRAEVLDVDRLSIEHHPPWHGATTHRNGCADRQVRRGWAMLCDKPKDVAVQAKDRGIRRAAEARRTAGHDVHHRLEVGRRAGDD